MEKGMNMGSIKQKNRTSILKLLKDRGAISRKDIAKLVQLTPAAVTGIVNEMIEENIIREIGEQEEDNKRVGRKKILVDINYNVKYVIGISIEAEICYIAISNINGKVISYITVSIQEVHAEAALKRIAKKCKLLLKKENLFKEDILGVGVGIIGPVDEKKGVSKHAYGLWDYEVNIKLILEQELQVNVVVSNNVRALAIAELDYEKMQNVNNMLFIKYGPGIGSAIIINNEIYTGSNSSAGEIGHTIVVHNGKVCRCGKEGCLETIASQAAIISSISKVFSKENTPILYDICNSDISNLNINNIIKSVETGEKNVVKIIEDIADYMALAISNMVTIYDPEKVVLYGELFKHNNFMNEFMKSMGKNLIGYDLNKFIFLSVLSSNSTYIGGISIAVREFFFNNNIIG